MAHRQETTTTGERELGMTGCKGWTTCKSLWPAVAEGEQHERERERLERACERNGRKHDSIYSGKAGLRLLALQAVPLGAIRARLLVGTRGGGSGRRGV